MNFKWSFNTSIYLDIANFLFEHAQNEIEELFSFSILKYVDNFNENYCRQILENKDT